MDEKRREFLKKAGKYAAYTSPTLMLLMNPSLEAIAKSGGQGGFKDHPKRGRGRSRRGGFFARLRRFFS